MINEQIRDKEIRLIDEEGNQVGVVSSKEAQKMADEKKLDLVKIAPDTKRYILIVDELADLINDKRSRAALIPKFLRIAQLGRAAGVHIVIATQRPDSQVINGTLKANIPSRMAFQTLSSIDSRIILEQSGAERLRGSGDGLYSSNGSTPERVQAPYIDIQQIKDTIRR